MQVIILQKIIMIFIILFIGLICSWTKIIDKHTRDKLSMLVANVINPALIFVSFQMEYDKQLAVSMVQVALLAFLGFGVAIVAARLLIREKEGYDHRVELFSGIYTNCGHVGLPLVMSILGTEGVICATVYMAVFNLFLWTHAIHIMNPNERGSIRNFLTPSIGAIVAGLFCFFMNFRIPEILYESLEYVGNMNTPMAMLVAGSIVSQIHPRRLLANKRLYLVAAVRLLVIPLCYILIVRLFPISDTIKVAAAILTACPTAAFGIIFSVRYRRDEEYAVELFALTTLLSLLTIPLCMTFI